VGVVGMKIITDVDGVLLDMTAPIRNLFFVEDKHFNQWDIQAALGITNAAVDMMWDVVWSTPLKMYPGAREWIDTMLAFKWKVTGLSTRATFNSDKPSGRDAAERDFGQLGIPYILTKKAYEKSEELKRLEPWDFFIEDNLTTAMEAGEKFGSDRVMLIDRPWNKSFDYSQLYRRINHGYPELLELMLAQEQEKTRDSRVQEVR
jgi:phosphoglycolate phosphatase-like HAD superfamily hydrolase